MKNEICIGNVISFFLYKSTSKIELSKIIKIFKEKI